MQSVTDRVYTFTKRGLQRGVPEGFKKCRDCLEVKIASQANFKADGSAVGRLRQPCRACRENVR